MSIQVKGEAQSIKDLAALLRERDQLRKINVKLLAALERAVQSEALNKADDLAARAAIAEVKGKS